MHDLDDYNYWNKRFRREERIRDELIESGEEMSWSEMCRYARRSVNQLEALDEFEELTGTDGYYNHPFEHLRDKYRR